PAPPRRRGRPAAPPRGREQAPRSADGSSKGALHCDVFPPPEGDSGFCVRSTAPIVDHPGGELAFLFDGKLRREPLPAGLVAEPVPLAEPPKLGRDIGVDEQDPAREVGLAAAAAGE